MAQITKPAIPAKMYRNFAIITIAMTAGLAFLADNQNAEALAEPSAQATPSPSASAVREPAYGRVDFRYGDGINVGNGYEDYHETAPGGGGGGGSARFISSSNLPAPGSENAGFTREYLDSLTEEELAQLLRELRASGVDNAATRQQAMAVMETASRRRSGRATSLE